jgi:hypothetical protein
MATQIRHGQIVWAKVADANGITKARPAVVMTTSDQISPTSLLELVAITSFFPDPLPDDHVLACPEPSANRAESQNGRRFQLGSGGPGERG